LNKDLKVEPSSYGGILGSQYFIIKDFMDKSDEGFVYGVVKGVSELLGVLQRIDKPKKKLKHLLSEAKNGSYLPIAFIHDLVCDISDGKISLKEDFRKYTVFGENPREPFQLGLDYNFRQKIESTGAGFAKELLR